MMRIRTLNNEWTHTTKFVKIFGDGYSGNLFLFSSPKGEVKFAVGSTYEAEELPIESLADKIISTKGPNVFREYEARGREYGEREWNELKGKLEKEHYFCPFCDFPSDVQSANWKLIPSIERLKSHISERHLKVSATLSVEDSKSNRYKDVKFVEEVKV